MQRMPLNIRKFSLEINRSCGFSKMCTRHLMLLFRFVALVNWKNFKPTELAQDSINLIYLCVCFLKRFKWNVSRTTLTFPFDSLISTTNWCALIHDILKFIHFQIFIFETMQLSACIPNVQHIQLKKYKSSIKNNGVINWKIHKNHMTNGFHRTIIHIWLKQPKFDTRDWLDFNKLPTNK